MVSKMFISSHSCRTVRLQRSMYLFCCCFPGWIYWIVRPCWDAQVCRVSLTYSGPLLTRMVEGLPRHSMMRFKVRVTRKAGSEKSTSMARPSRLKSSSTLTVLKLRPALKLSNMKSIDHVSLGRSSTARGSGFSLFTRFFGLIRRLNSNPQ